MSPLVAGKTYKAHFFRSLVVPGSTASDQIGAQILAATLVSRFWLLDISEMRLRAIIVPTSRFAKNYRATSRIGRWIMVVWVGVALLFAATTPVWAVDGIDPTTEILTLRRQYSLAMSRAQTPEEMTTLALTHSSRAWAMAAWSMSARYSRRDLLADLERYQADGRQGMAKANRAEVRQAAACLLLARSVAIVAGLTALCRQDKTSYKETRALLAEIEQGFAPERRGYGPTLAALSSGMVTLMALALRSTEQGRLYLAQADTAVRTSLAESVALAGRQDLHAHARLFLMYLIHARSCFQLVYYYGLAVDERLSSQLDPIRDAWRRTAADDAGAEVALVATMAAIAEATFPVTLALAR